MKIEDVKVGDKIVADDGFTCIKRGAVLTVQADKNGCLFVPCREKAHFLDGQIGEDGHLVGFTRAADAGE